MTSDHGRISRQSFYAMSSAACLPTATASGLQPYATIGAFLQGSLAFPHLCHDMCSPMAPSSPYPAVNPSRSTIPASTAALVRGLSSQVKEHLPYAISDQSLLPVNPFTKATLKLPDRYCFNRIDEPRRVINGHGIPNTVLDTHARILIWKLVVCSEVLVAAIVRGGGLWTLAFCSPGANLWYISALGKISLPSDIMFYDGKLYTVDSGGKLYSIIVKEDIDSGKLSLSRIERLISKAPFFLWPSSCYGRAMRQYLVESCGALLLVRRRNFRQPPGSDVYASRSKVVRIEFEVFKANFQSSQWENVSSVGDDQVLFVGVNSQSASVSQFREKGNCIFFFLHDSGRLQLCGCTEVLLNL